MCNFLLMWKGFLREVFWHEKKAFVILKAFAFTMVETRGIEPLDLLDCQSSQLSQLSYAPVTRRYYRGRLSLMQGLFWLNLLLTGFPGTGQK